MSMQRRTEQDRQERGQCADILPLMRIFARAAVATVAGLVLLGYLYIATAPVHNTEADMQALRETAAQYEVA